MLASVGSLQALAQPPRRTARAAPDGLPIVQFDMAGYLPPAEDVGGTLFQLGPVYTLFLTSRLMRPPTTADQRALAAALNTIEAQYPYRPSGIFTCVAYGLPYFNGLPGGANGDLVAGHMPRLLLDKRRYALEEAVPAPTDVSPDNPDVSRATFNIPLAIEQNDILLTLRSDVQENLMDVAAWISGSGILAGAALPSPRLDLLELTSTRLMFVQPGLPRRVAEAENLPYAGRIPPDSPLWMGFASHQADSSGTAASATFEGTASVRFTSAVAGDYFAGGSIQHLSHMILDLGQWYADDQPYLERVQQMFRSNPPPATGYADQFAEGGGPVFLANVFKGRDDARQNAIGEQTLDGTRRIGHSSALQRASRAADGTPFHVRGDGAGFDSMDTPSGDKLPKLHFSMFVPTAEVFERMRRYQAATDLATAYDVPPRHAGIERFTTVTRRQNFLVPPREHRAFPLLELL